MLLRAGFVALVAVAVLPAAVSRIQYKERTDYAAGKSFGATGPYEQITGTAYFRIDPKAPQNRGIVDIDLAPTNEAGLVEFTADIFVLKPRDPAKGNGTAIVDVPNRGRVLTPGAFTPIAGDTLLMDRGFTVVSAGWQWDVARIPERLALDAPRLKGNITGLARAEYVPDKTVDSFSLGDRDHIPYPVADESDPANRMTVSDGPGLPRREIPRNRWRFIDKGHVRLDGGCEPGKIYEVVYRATGAVPTGLGFAAIRDMASFLKFGDSPLGDQKPFIRRTIGFGTSQTGRFLRHMMYDGFNEDEQGRKALDGVWSHVAGAGRGGFNHRFAQPSRDGQPLLHYSLPVDVFPFADTEMTDPLTGRTEALLARVRNPKIAPKIFYTNGSYEYWGRAASLIHTTPDGKRDAGPDPNTRIYLLAGAQHGAGSLPLKKTNTQNTANPMDQRWIMRGLLIAMHEWLKDGVEPPPSVYPKLGAGELTLPANVKYPANVSRPRALRIPRVLDFGPELRTKGIVSVEPPKEGAAYPVLVPQVDANGNEIGGVRLPDLEIPLGVYTGWNLRAPAIGSPDRMIAFIGSFFAYPNATTRYTGKEAYLSRFRQSAQDLARRRFALADDVESMTQRAGALWDAVAQQ